MEDLTDLMSCFEAAILSINSAIYSEDQKRAWVQKGFENQKKWLERIENQYFILSESNKRIVGFTSVSQTGYVDLLFTHPSYQRKGVADSLYKLAEQHVIKSGVTTLETHASAVSKPFFEQRGFQLLGENKLDLFGISISNFHLLKKLR